MILVDLFFSSLANMYLNKKIDYDSKLKILNISNSLQSKHRDVAQCGEHKDAGKN